MKDCISEGGRKALALGLPAIVTERPLLVGTAISEVDELRSCL